MANYAKTNIGNEGRVELHDTLSLTGAEISINDLPAGANVPFVHSHKNNEEVYGILFLSTQLPKRQSCPLHYPFFSVLSTLLSLWQNLSWVVFDRTYQQTDSRDETRESIENKASTAFFT